jgi:hypothetical protein
MIRNAVQHGENVRNSLGLNYKSAALNQLSYAGVPNTKAVFSELIKSLHAHLACRAAKGSNFRVFFYGPRMV